MIFPYLFDCRHPTQRGSRSTLWKILQMSLRYAPLRPMYPVHFRLTCHMLEKKSVDVVAIGFPMQGSIFIADAQYFAAHPLEQSVKPSGRARDRTCGLQRRALSGMPYTQRGSCRPVPRCEMFFATESGGTEISRSLLPVPTSGSPAARAKSW